jgi:hypothetical protein
VDLGSGKKQDFSCDNHIYDVNARGEIGVKKKNNIPFIRKNGRIWTLVFPYQGWTNYFLKNPFAMLDLLFVVPLIVVNIFHMKKLHW